MPPPTLNSEEPHCHTIDARLIVFQSITRIERQNSRNDHDADRDRVIRAVYYSHNLPISAPRQESQSELKHKPARFKFDTSSTVSTDMDTRRAITSHNYTSHSDRMGTSNTYYHSSIRSTYCHHLRKNTAHNIRPTHPHRTPITTHDARIRNLVAIHYENALPERNYNVFSATLRSLS